VLDIWNLGFYTSYSKRYGEKYSVNERNAGSVWVPWACLPLLLLFNTYYYGFESVSFDLRLLQIPVAVALSYRYGLSGFVATLVGCAPLLVTIYMGPMTYGDWPALFVIVVHAAWLTLNDRWLNSKESTPPHAVSMSLLLVAGSMGLYYQPDFLGFNWWGPDVLYYAFFVLGMRAVQMRRWLTIAGLITIVGIFISLANSYGDFEILRSDQLPDNFDLDWQLDRPGQFLTLLVFCWMGRWLGTILRAAEPFTDTLTAGAKLVMGAGILYLAIPMWSGLVFAVEGGEKFYDSVMDILSPAGSPHILPLLALSLAITRRNGLLKSAVLLGTYYALFAIPPGSSFYIDFGDFTVVIAFAVLGARVAQRFSVQVPKFSWLLPLYPCEQLSIDLTEWKRQHDEISSTVRRVMMTMVAYTLFCALTLAAPDVSLIGVNSNIQVPLANTSIDFSAFVTVGPLILLGLVVYLHVFLQSAIDLGRLEGAKPLPYLFNMDNRLAVLLAEILLYWLPVLILFVFAWKTVPDPTQGYWLSLAATALGIVMAYLRLARLPPKTASIKSWFLRAAFATFAVMFVVQLFSDGPVTTRTLRLYDAKLEKQNLREKNLNSAWMENANLNEAILERADLRNADLTNANLDGANVVAANLRGANMAGAILNNADIQYACLKDVKDLTCRQLTAATNWDKAFRNEDMECSWPNGDPGSMPTHPAPRKDQAQQSKDQTSRQKGRAQTGEPGDEETLQSAPPPQLPWKFGDCL
jgi:hypothetical protein